MSKHSHRWFRRMRQRIGRGREYLRALLGVRGSRLVIGILGGSVVLVGIAMIVLPGPAVVVIPLGLAILATEFLWARRWLKRTRVLLYGLRKRRPRPLGKVSSGQSS